MSRSYLIVVIVLSGFFSWGSEKVLLEYFFNTNCSECNKISQFFLPALQEELGEMYTVLYRDLADENNFLRLISYLDRDGTESNENVYLVINQRIILGGREHIERNTAAAIRAEFEGGPREAPKLSEGKIQALERRINLGTVLIAGLLDGINPCAFATLVFLFSLLTSKLFSRRRLLAVGAVYIGACFVTYLAIGVGLFQFLSWLSGWNVLRLVLNGAMIAALVILAAISFADAILFKVRGASAVRLKLPEACRNYIHGMMRKRRQQAFVLSGTFLLGVMVTAVESVCTGQVYLPTLLFLVNNTAEVSHWWGYLFLYNTAFILPLVALFLAVYYGLRMQPLLRLSRWNVMISKLLMGLFFLVLAALLCYLEFFR